MNLIEIPIGSVAPSKTNPRTDFPAEYLGELATSIRQRGILNPLLVRRCESLGPDGAEFEIIAGECRWRAAKLAELAAVPVIVRDDLSDEDALELQLVENLQRRDLSILDEADGLAALLNMRGLDDSPRWTVVSLSLKLGKSHSYVRSRLRLKRLTPEGRQAVSNGTLTFPVARLICRIPSDNLRRKALLDVLKPEYEDEPLTFLKAALRIRTHYMVDLRGAPWKLADQELVPLQTDEEGARCFGGACKDCPFMSGNNPEDSPDIGVRVKVSQICTHPECFNAKLDAALEEERMTALKAGKKVLSKDESEKHLNPHSGGLRWNSPYILLNDQVPAEELRGNFKKPPTWKNLLADSPAMPEIVVLRDQRGAALELVDRRQAVAAIKLAAKARGEDPAIKTGRGTELDDCAAKAQKARIRDRQRFCRKTALESMHALRAAIQKKGLVDGFWNQMLDLGFQFAGTDGLWLISKWLDVQPGESKEYGGRDFEGPLRKAFEGSVDNNLISLVVMLMLSRSMKWAASPADHSPASNHEGTTADFEALALLYGVDLSEVRASVKLALEDKPKQLTVVEAAEEFKNQADAGVREARKAGIAKLVPVENKPTSAKSSGNKTL